MAICSNVCWASAGSAFSIAPTVKAVDEDEFRRWRDEADGALDTAELARTGGRLNWACFLAEQAAQLGVKAILHGLGAGPWGHDLVALGDRLGGAAATTLPEELEAALSRLSRHYIVARYPDALPGGSPGARYRPEEATQALADARVVLGAVDALEAQLRRPPTP